MNEEELATALADCELRERLVYANEEICNEIISRYLGELDSFPAVPVVRGYSALRPVSKPKTLAEAKSIVDGGV